MTAHSDKAVIRRGARFALLAAVAIGAVDTSRAAPAEVAPLPPAAGRTVDFANEIQPLLAARCYGCHGPERQKGGLRLDRKTAALKGGDSYAPDIHPGDSAASPLIHFVAGRTADMLMPPKGERLSPDEIGRLRAWIDQGAAWPERRSTEREAPVHWSFQPVVRPPVPKPVNPRWVRNAVDAFVLDRLEREGLDPSPEADRRTLIRRLSFDLLGLPPTPEEVRAFERDRTDAVYAELVERALARPQYGERWARHWLDVVRFAETHGFEMNNPRPTAWVYRDFVIRAFNEDQPYDRFVREQIAGDALGVDEATGFLVAGAWDQVKSPDEVLTRNQRADELHDMISTTGSAFLGLTVGCARCHEHKFDPIPQRDYYAIKAVFEGVQHGERPLRARDRERRRQEAEDQRRALEQGDRELARFVRPAFVGKTVLLDDEASAGADPTGARVLELIKPTARGEYAAGQARGETDDPGDASRLPNFAPGYRAWNQVAGKDVFAWEPRVQGRFRVFLSWGCGWTTHATDARYVLDGDGDLATRDDQRPLAQVNQQQFADGVGEVPNRPLWSGFFAAGIHEFSEASRIVLRGGATAAYVTADVIVLQEVEGDPAVAGGPQPILRAAVHPRRNVDRFAPLRAHRLRFSIQATTSAEPGLDELEVLTAEPAPRNVALAAAGTRAKASGTYPNNAFHKLEHLNDGRHGNSRSWIANEPGRGWVELEFAKPALIDRVVWGRDREGKFTDRLATAYRIEVDAGDGAWRLVASSADRALYSPGRGPAAALAFVATQDPETQRRLATLVKDRERQAARLRELETEPQGYVGLFVEPESTHRFHRGDPMQPREAVAPGALSQVATEVEFALPDGKGGELQRRLALADWITNPRHPLPARVMVNRIWQQHFGEGLVSTPSDFGANGAHPTHPELLDWLAAEFIAHRWSVKHIHRLILNSATYRQASTPDPAGLRRDAGARWLWRFPPRRLEAEPLRDAILTVSGNLDGRGGGPGWSPFEPNDNYVRVYVPRQEFGPAEWRRMVYATNVRQRPDGVFGVFDCPDGGQIAPKRTRSTTPLQALNLLNSGFMLQQSRLFAARLEREAGTCGPDQIQRAFALAFNRGPTPAELGAGVRLVAQHGLALFCRALFNANEFVYLF